jgi:hypothetical protein
MYIIILCFALSFALPLILLIGESKRVSIAAFKSMIFFDLFTALAFLGLFSVQKEREFLFFTIGWFVTFIFDVIIVITGWTPWAKEENK